MSDRTDPLVYGERNPLVLPGDRGTENHGVPQYGTPDPDVIDYGNVEGDPVVYDPKPAPKEAMPVYIVTSGDRLIRTFRTGRGYATLVPSGLVGKFEARSSTRVTNLSATAGDRVWVGADPNSASPQNGYPLDPGKEIVLNAETPIFVTADPAAPGLGTAGYVQVAILQDYQIPVQ